MPEICVILLNLGGPGNGKEIKPFLKAMFADPDLIRMPMKGLLAPLIVALRTPRVRSRYDLIGGKSPLLGKTEAQAMALEGTLNRDGRGRFKVLIGMRYTSPSIHDALDRAAAIGCQQVVALSMYPQYCGSTTGSSLNELRLAQVGREGGCATRIIDHYPEHPGYIEALANTVRAASKPAQSDPFILFSAHGVPQQMVKDGDPYVDETKATAVGVVKKLGISNERWQLSFQSRMGPVRWVGPSSDKTIDDLGACGVDDLVIVPISFTADNLETLYDINIVLTQKAHEAGISRVYQAPALNNDETYINALADLVEDALLKESEPFTNGMPG